MIEWLRKMAGKHPTLYEIFKFLVIGGIATLIDFLVMSIVLYAWDPSLYKNFIDVFFGNRNPSTVATVVGTGLGFCVGLVFNYIFSILFVFKESARNSTKRAKTFWGFNLFAILSGVGLFIHLVGMYIGYDLLGMNEWIIKCVLTAIVLVFNYITRKYLIFNKKKTVEMVA